MRTNNINRQIFILLLCVFLISCVSNSNDELRVAVLKNDITQVKELINKGASLKSEPRNEKLIVLIVAKANIAITLGKDNNHKDISEVKSCDPLQIATANGNMEMLEILLKNGAPINRLVATGLTDNYSPSLKVAKEQLNYENSEAEIEKIQKIINFLIKKGAKN